MRGREYMVDTREHNGPSAAALEFSGDLLRVVGYPNVVLNRRTVTHMLDVGWLEVHGLDGVRVAFYYDEHPTDLAHLVYEDHPVAGVVHYENDAARILAWWAGR